MDENIRHKTKSKATNSKAKPVTQKGAKKKKNEGPSCSMFLAEITRKLAIKKKQEAAAETPNVVGAIIESLTNALPVKLSKTSPSKNESSTSKIGANQEVTPEVKLNNVPDKITEFEEIITPDLVSLQPVFKIPKMPVASSEVIKAAYDRNRRNLQRDAAVNTAMHPDVATEITKHVATLRKISMIAEEFNKKTARNLKQIVDSVEEDLLKKLDEIKGEQMKSVVFQDQSGSEQKL